MEASDRGYALGLVLASSDMFTVEELLKLIWLVVRCSKRSMISRPQLYTGGPAGKIPGQSAKNIPSCVCSSYRYHLVPLLSSWFGVSSGFGWKTDEVTLIESKGLSPLGHICKCFSVCFTLGSGTDGAESGPCLCKGCTRFDNAVYKIECGGSVVMTIDASEPLLTT
jgi:hypothetical protein